MVSVEAYNTSDPNPWAKVSRRLLARNIVGSGLEIGPGHVPFPVGPGTSIRVVDRWRPEENRELFDELGDAKFAMPDIVADLNTERLQAVPDASQDFVICSHVLEHVAEPIGLLADIHRVLRPGGVMLLLLPDRHRTFDRNRDGTPLAHLVAEYESGVTEVDDEHLIEYLQKVSVPSASSSSFVEGIPIGDTPEERRETLDVQRRRSIHVHCWDDEEFFLVLLWGIEHLGWRWEFIDGMVTDDEGDTGIEFGFVFRVCDVDEASAVVRDRLDAGWHLWRESRVGLLDSLATAQRRAAAAEHAAAVARQAAGAAEEAAGVLQARLDRIDRSLPMRLYHFGRRVTRRG